MSLMMNLDDAMKVLKNHGFLKDEWVSDPGGLEVIRNELEQKCYIMLDKDLNGDKLLRDIQEINVRNICDSIEDGETHQWCQEMQDLLMGDIDILLRREKRMKEEAHVLGQIDPIRKGAP